MKKQEFFDKMMEIFEEIGIEYVSGNKVEADSIQYISLVSSVEDRFEISLPDEFLNFSSIQNVDVFLESIFELVDNR